MACGGCRKNQQKNIPAVSSTANDLTKFAFLTPKQLRLLEQQGKKPSGK